MEQEDKQIDEKVLEIPAFLRRQQIKIEIFRNYM